MSGRFIDGFNADKRDEIDTASKSSDFATYDIHRHHNQVDQTTLSMAFVTDDVEPIKVCLKDTEPNTDPLKSVAQCELLIKNNEYIIGIDLNGDVVDRKDN